MEGIKSKPGRGWYIDSQYWPQSIFPGPLQFAPSKSLVQVQADPEGSQGLSTGKRINVPLLSSGTAPQIPGAQLHQQGGELHKIRLLIVAALALGIGCYACLLKSHCAQWGLHPEMRAMGIGHSYCCF